MIPKGGDLNDPGTNEHADEHENGDEEFTDKRIEELFAEPILDPAAGVLPSLDWIQKNFSTKSAAIRYLLGQGHPATVIAKLLKIRYQHVKNVQGKTLKRGPQEVFHDLHWQCSHTKDPFIDVVLRTGVRDPSADKILYRICVHCAYDLVPGVTRASVAKFIPGVKITERPSGKG